MSELLDSAWRDVPTFHTYYYTICSHEQIAGTSNRFEGTVESASEGTCKVRSQTLRVLPLPTMRNGNRVLVIVRPEMSHYNSGIDARYSRRRDGAAGRGSTKRWNSQSAWCATHSDCRHQYYPDTLSLFQYIEHSVSLETQNFIFWVQL